MQSSKDNPGPGGAIGHGSSQSDTGKFGGWKDNIHLTEHHDDPLDKHRLIEHSKLLNEHDKFIDFINHVESKFHFSQSRVCSLQLVFLCLHIDSKQQRRERQLNEIISIGATSGKPQSSYLDLNFAASEWEEELEQRDFREQAKYTQSNTNHSQFACIGSESCFKQKAIRKLFVHVLQDLKKSHATLYEKPSASPSGSLQQSEQTLAGAGFSATKSTMSRAIDVENDYGLGTVGSSLNATQIPLSDHLLKNKLNEKNNQHTAEFMKLMDYIKEQKRAQKNDQLFRQNYR